MRARFRLGIAALLLCAASWMPAQTAAPAAGGYRIAGRVVDTVTGAPVSRATVSLLSEDDYKLMVSGVTDAEGHFSFVGIPAGKYPLTAAKRGYRTAYYDEHDDFNSAIVTGEGQETGSLVFRLAPGAVLYGVVTGDGGDPVENAQVMLFKQPADGRNNGRMQQVNNVQTDDAGGYEFNELQAGEYYIAVKGEPWFAQHGNRSPLQEQSPLDVAYSITYYDSTTEEGAATPIRLSWGSREEANINLHAVPALRFRVPQSGRPTDRPQITLQQKVFGDTVNTERMEIADGANTGTWELPGIAPGTYEVELGNPPRSMTVNAASNIDLDPNAGTPTQTVSGSIVMAGGGTPPEDVSLVLNAGERAEPPAQADVQGGRFEFNAVSPGTWTLNAGSPKQTLAVVATAVGGAVTSGDKVEVRDKPVNVTVMLSRAQARVNGIAIKGGDASRKGGRGAPGAMIVLVPRASGAYPALVRRDQSDSDGSFSLRDVPAGQYTVVAIEDGWKLEWQRREAIEPYLRSGVAVTVTDQAGPVVKLNQPVQAVAAR